MNGPPPTRILPLFSARSHRLPMTAIGLTLTMLLSACATRAPKPAPEVSAPATPPPVEMTTSDPAPVTPTMTEATLSTAEPVPTPAVMATPAIEVAELPDVAEAAPAPRPSTRDQMRAAEWIRHGADRGEPWAFHMLGELYQAGLGVPQDDALAAQWFQRGADAEIAEAQTALARLYLTGTGVPQDIPQALALVTRAAAQGQAEGQYLLGVMTMQGRGITAQPSEAIPLWKKSAKQGFFDAMLQLGMAYEQGNGITASSGTAMRWYYKAGLGFLQDNRPQLAMRTLTRMQSLAPDNKKIVQLQAAIAAP